MSFPGHGVNTKSVDIGLNYLFVQLSTFKKNVFIKVFGEKPFFYYKKSEKIKKKIIFKGEDEFSWTCDQLESCR